MKAQHLLIFATLTATSLAMGSSKALAATFAIDTFDVPIDPPANTPLFLNTVGQSATQIFTGLDPTEVIGGNRQVDLSLTSFNGLGRPRVTSEVQTGSGNFDGVLDIANQVSTKSVATLQYTDILSTGQGNFGVLSGPNDQRGIAITQQYDGIPFTYTLTIGDGVNMSTVSKVFNPTNLNPNSLTRAVFTFDDILNSNLNTGVDLSMVNYVKLVIAGEAGLDIAITDISGFEVPEPSTLLGLLAVLGAGAVSIKRKPKAD